MHRYLLSLLAVVSLLLLGGRWRSGTVWFPPGGCTESGNDPLIVEEFINGEWTPITTVHEGDCLTGKIPRLQALRACCEVAPTTCSGFARTGTAGLCASRRELP